MYTAQLWWNYKKSTITKLQIAYHNILKMFLGMSKYESTSYLCTLFDIQCCQSVIRKLILPLKLTLTVNEPSPPSSDTDDQITLVTDTALPAAVLPPNVDYVIVSHGYVLHGIYRPRQIALSRIHDDTTTTHTWCVAIDPVVLAALSAHDRAIVTACYARVHDIALHCKDANLAQTNLASGMSSIRKKTVHLYRRRLQRIHHGRGPTESTRPTSL